MRAREWKWQDSIYRTPTGIGKGGTGICPVDQRFANHSPAFFQRQFVVTVAAAAAVNRCRLRPTAVIAASPVGGGSANLGLAVVRRWCCHVTTATTVVSVNRGNRSISRRRCHRFLLFMQPDLTWFFTLAVRQEPVEALLNHATC